MKRILLIALCFVSIFANSQILINPNNKGKILRFQGGTSSLPIFDARYLQSAEGADLVDATGTYPDLPYVSGYGTEQVFDLEILADTTWNKNAYIGNAFSLPEYYDFPYSQYIYYNSLKPYHWKIKDFHYRYYEEQADALTNIGFAKLTYGDSTGEGLICNTQGSVYNASSNVYGVWEFTATTVSTSDMYIYLLSDDIAGSNGYIIRIRASTERVYLIRNDGGSATNIMLTNSAAFKNMLTYQYRVVRNSTTNEYVTGAIGTWGVFIRGNAYGDTFTLLSSILVGSNPVTDNTHTTSNYTLISNDPGDYVRDYSINGVAENFNNWIDGTGVYSADNLSSSNELLLYSSEQTEPNLSKIKTYIGIVPTYNSSDLVTNGTFTTDSDWTKGTGWTISAGTANCSGTIANLSQDVGGIKGMCCYKLDFDITAFSGTVLSAFPGTSGTQFGAYTSTGHKTATVTWNGTDAKLYFVSTLFTGSIDNVVLKRIFENYYNNE